MTACVDPDDLVALRQEVRSIRVSEELRYFMVDLVRGTRELEDVALGASARAGLALMHCSQALAAFDGLEFVTPDHVLELAVPVMAHRLVMDNQARYSGVSPEHLVEEMLRNIAVPG